MNFYKRNLPHWHPANAEFFITVRLANSLPKIAAKKLKAEQKILRNSNINPSQIQRTIFRKYEQLLDNSDSGPTWLSKSKIADLVKESIHHRDKKIYDLYCFCIMPNHVHMVFKINKDNDLKKHGSRNQPTLLTKVLKELKRYTAREANKLLNLEGQFWQHESFDRVIRNNEELERTIAYTLNNPVKAGLVEYWENWPYSYCKPDFVDTFRK